MRAAESGSPLCEATQPPSRAARSAPLAAILHPGAWTPPWLYGTWREALKGVKVEPTAPPPPPPPRFLRAYPKPYTLPTYPTYLRTSLPQAKSLLSTDVMSIFRFVRWLPLKGTRDGCPASSMDPTATSSCLAATTDAFWSGTQRHLSCAAPSGTARTPSTPSQSTRTSP